VDGPPGSSKGHPDPASYAWIDTEHQSGRRRYDLRLWFAAGLVAVLIAAGAAVWEVAKESYWPSGCNVSGHPDWCSDPSDAITDPTVVALAHAYCPALSELARADVVPQPFSELRLADDDTFAKTSGGPESGSEDVLLGAPGAVAWVTRWQDGLVEVRCPGSSLTTPSLRLRADQFASTVASVNSAADRRVNFADVATQLVTTPAAQPRGDVSYGFLTCDTGDVDLDAPEVGETFSCAVQVFGFQGQGAYRASYRITDEDPYFEPAT
jgi:hypothetical protein